MNKVILIGRLTKDPEVRYTQGENSMAIASYTIAVDRAGRKKDDQQQSADFIRCKAFGKSGEFVEKYLKKGTKIAITGRIETGSYQNKEGQTVYTTDVIVESHEFCESRASQGGNAQGGNVDQTQPASQGQMDGFMNVPDGFDEELPFN